MVTKFKIVPYWKKDLSNKENIWKIGVFFQKVSWNNRIVCTKIQEKKFKNLKNTKPYKKKKKLKIQISGDTFRFLEYSDEIW